MWELLGDYYPRLVAFLLSIIAMFSPSIMQNVDLTIMDKVTTKSEELHIEIKNHTGTTISTGEAILLERMQGDTWVEVEQNGPAPGFIEIGILVPNLSSHTQTVNVIKTYGDCLAEGEYRITKEYHGTLLPGDYSCSVTFYVSAPKS